MNKKQTVEMKKKTAKDKTIKVKMGAVYWHKCPHCEKTVFLGEVEVVGILMKWKKELAKLK